ncbi:MAG TPA: hypothetical protein VD861_17685, partial [Pyrinomonadaceae bacterium]|nr:hypothetical protein [Pyrinomonadaceae bacterium]
MHQLSALAVEEIDAFLAPGDPRPPANSNRLAVRRDGGRKEFAYVVIANGHAQHAQEPASRELPDMRRLVIGGSHQKPSGAVNADASD